MVFRLFLCNKPHRNSGLKQQFNHFFSHECWGWAQPLALAQGPPAWLQWHRLGSSQRFPYMSVQGPGRLTWGPPCASFSCGLSSIAAQGS